MCQTCGLISQCNKTEDNNSNCSLTINITINTTKQVPHTNTCPWHKSQAQPHWERNTRLNTLHPICISMPLNEHGYCFNDLPGNTVGSASELTHERASSLICCPEQDEISWAAFGKEGWGWGIVQWHRESSEGAGSVIGNISKSDIELGKEDELTEVFICPWGGRIRDLKGSERMCWGSV